MDRQSSEAVEGVWLTLLLMSHAGWESRQEPANHSHSDVTSKEELTVPGRLGLSLTHKKLFTVFVKVSNSSSGQTTPDKQAVYKPALTLNSIYLSPACAWKRLKKLEKQ